MGLLAAWKNDLELPTIWISPSAEDLLGAGKLDSGLVVIFGETGSGKSVLADRICQHVFDNLRGGKGHVLRFGDPVEGAFNFHTRYGVQLGQFSDVAVETQRNLGSDTPSLDQFGMDALRQKPALVSVSELRSSADMLAALELASTGHLVVATAHSGSLKEGFARLMNAYGCFANPDLKAPLISSVRCLIHVESKKVNLRELEGPSRKYKIVLPTVWSKTPSALVHFIADGPQMITPSSGASSDAADPLYYYSEPKTVFNLIARAVIDLHTDPSKLSATATCKSDWQGVNAQKASVSGEWESYVRLLLDHITGKKAPAHTDDEIERQTSRLLDHVWSTVMCQEREGHLNWKKAMPPDFETIEEDVNTIVEVLKIAIREIY
ncbi:ATPase, T2SS/T4P/T4SS family [Fimbriimonas ginsengisoli]|nr:ATPase, T2SS/T4P/T4SS family [Fimbriimonas ginsengisoli]